VYTILHDARCEIADTTGGQLILHDARCEIADTTASVLSGAKKESLDLVLLLTPKGGRCDCEFEFET